jgi:hypothetical protein
VVHKPPMVSGHYKNNLDWLHSCDQSKDFIKVNSLLLHVSLCYEPCLMSDNFTIFFLLELENPLQPDHSMSLGQVH